MRRELWRISQWNVNRFVLGNLFFRKKEALLSNDKLLLDDINVAEGTTALHRSLQASTRKKERKNFFFLENWKKGLCSEQSKLPSLSRATWKYLPIFCKCLPGRGWKPEKRVKRRNVICGNWIDLRCNVLNGRCFFFSFFKRNSVFCSEKNPSKLFTLVASPKSKWRREALQHLPTRRPDTVLGIKEPPWPLIALAR